MTSRGLTRLVVLAGTLFLTACGSVDLGPEWRPLERVVSTPGVPDGVAFTITPNVFVRDVSEFQAARPGERWTAFLLHEQEHARRQAPDLVVWLARYGRDPAFAWEEEQRGWYLEIQHLKRSGFRVSPEAVATALAGYKTTLTRQQIVSYPEALAWVRDVLAGRWKAGE